ncbi:MAG: energy transducer TonB [Proteobacteria bacterium]|nr:energy transducer TonB [Pseudomonadota bacterium]
MDLDGAGEGGAASVRYQSPLGELRGWLSEEKPQERSAIIGAFGAGEEPDRFDLFERPRGTRVGDFTGNLAFSRFETKNRWTQIEILLPMSKKVQLWMTSDDFAKLPKKAVVPKLVMTGDPYILGSLDRSDIASVVNSFMHQIRYCYQRELAKDDTIEGTVMIKFVIDKEGHVQQANVASSTMGNEMVENCLVARFKSFLFPKPAGGGIVIVKYPLVFEKG